MVCFVLANILCSFALAYGTCSHKLAKISIKMDDTMKKKELDFCIALFSDSVSGAQNLIKDMRVQGGGAFRIKRVDMDFTIEFPSVV